MCCLQGYGAVSGVQNGQGPQHHGNPITIQTLSVFMKHKTHYICVISTQAKAFDHSCLMVTFLGRRPQNGGGVGRMLMPSKGQLKACLLSTFLCFWDNFVINNVFFLRCGSGNGCTKWIRWIPNKRNR